MVAEKKALGFILLFGLGFLLGIARAADDSSEPLLQLTSSSYEYDGKEANKGINPYENAANGAADPNVIFLFPVYSYSLGIETLGGIRTTLIPMNAKTPIKVSQTFTTYLDYQTSVSIKVYKGERRLTKDCSELGRFDLTGIQPAPRGVPQIEVTFEVDEDKILRVRAEDKATRKSESITITNYDGRLSQKELEEMVKATEEFEEQCKMKQKLVTYIYDTRSTINDKNKFADSINSNDKEKIERKLEEALKWLDANQKRKKEDYNEKLKEVEAVCNPVIERAYDKNDERLSSS